MSLAPPMTGSFPLTAAAVEQHVTADGPGAYALGFSWNNVFTVQNVGRADDALRAALLAQADAGRYAAFKFVATANAHDAFERECELFHQFGGLRHLDNTAHPARPQGAGWKCPHCTIYGIRDWSALAR